MELKVPKTRKWRSRKQWKASRMAIHYNGQPFPTRRLDAPQQQKPPIQTP